MAIQIGVGMGAEVIAFDIAEEKLAMARSLGAGAVFNARGADAAAQARARGGVQVALVTSASKAAYDTAFRTLRPTGTLLVVGLPAEDICFPPILMAAGEVHIRASAVGTREDLRQVLAMGAEGKIHCEVTTRPLAEVNRVFDDLRAGLVAGRVVVLPA
jgi:propanol-preferring alcohol dehydrogenase